MTDSETEPRAPAPSFPCCPCFVVSPLDEDTAAEVAAVFKALADPARVRIVSLLASAPGGEVCGCDLPGSLDRSQPTISHHMSTLVRAGLVAREQRGKWAWFSLRRESLDALCVAMGGCAAGGEADSVTG